MTAIDALARKQRGQGKAVRRQPQLDGLRAIAIVLVLYTHFLPERFWLWDIYWGQLGVRLFFVLSGFLITGQLLALGEANSSLGRALVVFYARRFLRLAPVYYLVIAVLCAAGFQTIRNAPLWHLLYASNIYFALQNSLHGPSHFWSLAVEEQFYLVWPFVIFFAPRSALRPMCVLGILLCFAWRTIAAWVGFNDLTTSLLLPNSLDAICLGALCAMILRSNPSLMSGQRFNVIGLLGLLAWIGSAGRFWGSMTSLDLTSTAAAVPSAWLVVQAASGVGGKAGAFLGAPAVAYLGRISYAVYVVHWFVPPPLSRFAASMGWDMQASAILSAVASTVVTLAIAAVLRVVMEKPVDRFRRSVFPSPEALAGAVEGGGPRS